MINICFDGSVLKNGLLSNISRTGVYFVARNIFLGLYKRNKQINMSLYLDKDDISLLEQLNKSLDINIKPNDVLTNESDFSNIDAFLSPLYKYPDIVKKYPNVSCYTVLHDVTPLIFPEYFKNCDAKWFKELAESLIFDDYYFTNSNYTKSDFLKYYSLNLDSNKIIPMMLSTNMEYQPNKDSNRLVKACEKYNIPADKKYLFSLCSLEPRKNLIRSVKTFIEFIKKNNIDDLVYVLGGGAWAGFIEKLEKEVPDYQNYSDKIIRAGYVADEDLETLYSGAEFFVYTSQYEGFGMPPLEAMKCGCPVITSNNSSLPEVVGDAGIMIDWDSDEQHIAAYEKYYFDKKYRDSMAKKGLERSKQFSWDKTVDVILDKILEVEKLKSNTPLVTIVTAVYNLIKGGRENTFKQTIESVQNQTYKNIEHIVIDGASNDGTIDLLKDYQDKGLIKYYSEPDKGIYDAMNKGILKAKGKYVVCLNSDDFYCDRKAVEYMVKRAESTNSDAVYGNAVRVNPETLEVISYWPGKENFYPLFGACPCHQTLCIKTDVMKELGLYDIKYKVSADNIFMTKMVQHDKKFSGIDVNIVCFRDDGFSNSNFALSEQERINGFYKEYGQYHGLTKYDCEKLFSYNFVLLPLDEAIALGSKLEKNDWKQSYFTKLFEYQTQCIQQRIVDVAKQKINECWLFDIILLLKTTFNHNVKRYLLCGFFPLLKVKYNEDKVKTYLFCVIPLTYVSHKHGVYKLRIFGIPVLKIKG